MELYARQHACEVIEKLGRDSFRQRIMSLLFPSRNHMIAVFHNHFVQRRDFIRAILQVCVHSNYNPALRSAKSGLECCRFSEIPVKAYSLEMVVELVDFL